MDIKPILMNNILIPEFDCCQKPLNSNDSIDIQLIPCGHFNKTA